MIDIARYPESTDKSQNQLYKLIHAFFSPSVEIVSGISATQFTVGAGDIGKMKVGATVQVHDYDYTNLSDEVKVSAVDTGTNTVTVDASLGFTPTAGMRAEYIGFSDGGGAYRYI